MALKIYSESGFQFGILDNPPKLPPGYKLEQSADKFAMARSADGKLFYLHCDHRGLWGLVPQIKVGAESLGADIANRIRIE